VLQRLTGQQIQRFITSLSRERPGKRKLAPKSVILIHTVLHAALDQAVEWKLITDNPADGITLPRVERGPLKALTRPQAKAFILAARGERLELALRLLLSLGLRRGEVAGLRWCDIDFENGRLHINGTLTYIEQIGLVWDTPKNHRRRSLKLPAKLVAALRWHQTRQAAERKAMGDKWKTPASPDVDYVFVASTTGGALNSDQIYVTFKRVAKAAGLPDHFSPHSLRHSCASFLYAEGVPDKVISTHLGHSNTNITKEIYISLYQDTLDDTAERVEKLLDDDIDERLMGEG
jgi:integrase